MDKAQTEQLDRIEELARGSAAVQGEHGNQLRMIAERVGEFVNLLTPQKKDGPGLDQLIGHMIGLLNELTSYMRQVARGMDRIEKNMPGDVAREMARPNAAANGAAVGRVSDG